MFEIYCQDGASRVGLILQGFVLGTGPIDRAQFKKLMAFSWFRLGESRLSNSLRLG
jgi:hypothetical protein